MRNADVPDNCSAASLTFSDRLEIPFLHSLSKSSIKTSQRLRLLVVITWSIGGLRILRLLLQCQDAASCARLATLLVSILLVVGNAAVVTRRLSTPEWKRVHDERIKLWTWKVTALGCLVGSVLFKENENAAATPLGNSVLLSVTLVFDQIRLHISYKLVALQLLSLQLMECGRWFSSGGAPASLIVHHILYDTVIFLVIGGAAPLMYLAGMEARARLKFLQQHDAVSSLQPFWRRVLRLQGFDLREEWCMTTPSRSPNLQA